MKIEEHEEQDDSQPKLPSDILGTISFAQQNEILRTFDPQEVVFEYLEKLPPREKLILETRYGLGDGNPLTLETIGTKIRLTRERVRQIEKDALKKLQSHPAPENFRKFSDLVFQFIENRGNIATQEQILNALCTDQTSSPAKHNILFILQLKPEFNLLKSSARYHESWFLAGLDFEFLDAVNTGVADLLREHGKPLPLIELTQNLRQRMPASEISTLPDEAIESYLLVSKAIGRNPFGEFGLALWPQIKPHDVGDKAYLVLLHLGKPEHYGKITELINKRKFDERNALKESVHNELIKDNRFVLVGRGIYGLAEWGYQPGVVAEIIAELIAKAGKPLSRDEIIAEVLKQRVVKRNTIIVGLSNKNKFQKTPENKYINAA